MTLRIGLVGCGNISDIYLTNLSRFPGTRVTAIADLKVEAALAQGTKYGLPATTPAELLKRDDVDCVLNLTIPAAHAEVTLAALDAGKHVYSEKPLAATLADGRAIVAAARARSLRVGCAPDTVLGPGVQRARAMIDEGRVGTMISGTASILSHGMEHWHPNPEFFFKPGGGPVLDMGPYYIAALVTLLGPVARVQASGRTGFAQRTVTAPGPMQGRSIAVEVLTSVSAILSFASGADVVFMASWDVWAHGQRPIELHGTEASLRVPDPNWFGGTIELAERDRGWQDISTASERLGAINWPEASPRVANWRGLGLAEMGAAIREGRPHRASGDIALHVLEVMSAILEAAAGGRPVEVPGCERPAALGEAEALALAGMPAPLPLAAAV